MRACLLACVILLMVVTAAFPAVTPESFVGDWEGTLEALHLRVVLHLKHDGGKWTATMDSPDQGGYGAICDEARVDGAKLYLALDAVDMEFDGTLSKNGNEIEGIFTQHGQRLPLTLARSGGTPKAAPAAPPVDASQQRFAGDWAGALDAGMKLRLVVHLTLKDGAWSGTMDSLDQGANGMPINSIIIIDGATLRFEMAAIGGRYEGTMSDDGQSIKGTWSQGGGSLPLDLKRGDASSMPAPKRPQEPKPPFPYKSEDVTVPGPGGITLAGTLTMPEGKGPFAAVVLVSGSGPQDRDETVFNHKPFLVLADHLTKAGFAVLRMDDRGTGKSGGSYTTATTDDFAKDAEAAVAFLKSRKEIDRKRVGLVGHSEGGIIAPIVAARNKDVAFIVLMAGVGVPGEQLLIRQSGDILRANGATEMLIQINAKAQRRMFAIVRSEPDSAAVVAKLNAAADSVAAEIGAMDPTQAEMAKQTMRRGSQMMASPWFRYLLTIDPAATLRTVKVPVLAINGSLDLQVAASENLAAIEKALRDGGNKDVTTKELPGLNHLFQTATTGSPMEYSTIEETFAPAAMNVVSDWLLAKTSTKKK
jgi:pimeloyl-ACP methyl ester carboxylesterase